MNLVLLGYPYTKRTEYFLKAAADLKTPLRFVQGPSFTPSLKNEGVNEGISDAGFDFSQLEDSVVKVDPPLLSCHIGSVNGDISRYIKFLHKLQQCRRVRLLNSSCALEETLDKFACKQRLEKGGLPVTPALANTDPSKPDDSEKITSASQLNKLMIKKKNYSVFIKPRYGSASAGVIAYRLNPRTGENMIETSAVIKEGSLVNTKKLRKIKDQPAINSIVSQVLCAGAIIESWIPKASYNGKAYDLRAVFQFGRLEYLLARQSSGAITNLHLNNNALPIEKLNLSPACTAKLETLCSNAASQFPGLNVAGFDILLRKDGEAMIIEINGQGDLIHHDIYAENRIYKAQIRAMKNLL